MATRGKNINLFLMDGHPIGGLKLNEIKESILDYMTENPKITAAEIAEKLNLTTRRGESNINKLKNYGIVEHTGSRKTGEWVIRQKF
jgi:ATP-dependent DNA helicase RecG